MSLLRSSRLVLALGIVSLSVVSAMVAAERSASAMATAANHFLESLTPDQRAEAAFEFQSDERTQVAFHPDGDVSPQWTDPEGDDRYATGSCA